MCLQVIAAQQGRLEARTSTNHFFTPRFCTISDVPQTSCVRFEAIAMPGMLHQALPINHKRLLSLGLTLFCEEGAQIVA